MWGVNEQRKEAINPRNFLFDYSLKPTATHIGLPDPQQPKYVVPLEDNNFLYSISLFVPTARAFIYFMRFQVVLLRMRSGFARRMYAESECLRELKRRLGCEDALAIMAAGTPGPYNKATVLFKNPDGSLHSFIKIATSVQAISLVNKERHMLKTLQQSKELAKYVPKVISDNDSGNYAYLAMFPVEGGVPTKKLHKEQLRFLNTLNVETHANTRFNDSNMWITINRRYSSIEKFLSEEWKSRFTNSLATISEGLSEEAIPMSLAHRDYAPWNMRLVRGRLYVFDWEYAEQGYLPLYDIFHYLVMPIVLRRRLKLGLLNKLKSAVHDIVMKNYSIREVAYRPDLQLLAYMTDVCLFYLEANEGCDQNDKVLTRYAEAIDDYSKWSEQI